MPPPVSGPAFLDPRLLHTFLWGFLGSAAVEVVGVVQAFSADEVALPARYRRVGFWIARFVLACVAGALAVAYDIDKALLALNVGAATPLIIQALFRGIAPPAITGGAVLPVPPTPSGGTEALPGPPARPALPAGPPAADDATAAPPVRRRRPRAPKGGGTP